MCVSGVLALQISCFSEAERIYMLAKDTTINNRILTSLVLPEIQVRPTCRCSANQRQRSRQQPEQSS